MKHWIFAVTMATTFLFTFQTPPADASGVFTLRGKLREFIETTYVISTKSLTYELRKFALAPQQIQTLKATKIGQPVELVISTQTIEAIR